jgi:hypothetical protein
MKLTDKRLDKYRNGDTPEECIKMPAYYCLADPEHCKTNIQPGVNYSCDLSLHKSVITMLHKRKMKHLASVQELPKRNNKINIVDIPLAAVPISEPEEPEQLFLDELPPSEEEPPRPPPPTHCATCNTKLTRLPWNTACDILYCENSKCSRFHQPQGRVLIGRLFQSDANSEALERFTYG